MTQVHSKLEAIALDKGKRHAERYHPNVDVSDISVVDQALWKQMPPSPPLQPPPNQLENTLKHLVF